MSQHIPEMTAAARAQRSGGPRHDDEAEPLVSLSDISEIELLILRRMRDVTIGDHRSNSHGSGFDFVGLRDWQAGDRPSAVDWAQSSLTNFSPLIVREFEQPSTASVVVVADGSLSTRCGVNGVSIATPMARTIATIGMSAVFFQDLFGMVTFDGGFANLGAIRPRIGRGHVIHCLDAYQHGRGLQELRQAASLSMTLASFLRKTALIPFVSDFLFENPEGVLKELSLLNTTHDVFVVLIDSSFAFELPHVSAGWIEAFDVETGRSRMMSRGALARMAARVREWQEDVVKIAKGVDIDVVRVGPDMPVADLNLAEFVAERRLRKVA
jgi:uncharacterized protein (DUF58 family)